MIVYAKHPINPFIYFKSSISFAPWALDSGPSTPSTRNSAYGDLSFNWFKNGIEAPSWKTLDSFPLKNNLEASFKIILSLGEKDFTFNPVPAAMIFALTVA